MEGFAIVTSFMVRHTKDKAGWESHNLPIRSQTGDLQGEACNFAVQGGSLDAFDLLPGLFSEPLGEKHGETHNKFNLACMTAWCAVVSILARLEMFDMTPT